VEKEGNSKRSEENLVKKTCRELGITQKELAERIGVNKNSVSDWANNKTPISKLVKTTLNLLKVEKDCIHFRESMSGLMGIQAR
jgi:transcriptional regulator with XRE-family HTH domain